VASPRNKPFGGGGRAAWRGSSPRRRSREPNAPVQAECRKRSRRSLDVDGGADAAAAGGSRCGHRPSPRRRAAVRRIGRQGRRGHPASHGRVVTGPLDRWGREPEMRIHRRRHGAKDPLQEKCPAVDAVVVEVADVAAGARADRPIRVARPIRKADRGAARAGIEWASEALA
jgi:hypothetical protein